MNIVFLDASTLGPEISFTEIEALGNFVKYGETPPDAVIDRLADADIAIVNKTRMTAGIIDACPKLKLICVASTGMNNIDLEHAAGAGVKVMNVAGYSTDSVVQLTYGMLIMLMMKIPYFDAYVKSEAYSNSTFFTHYGRCFSEMAGKRIGIIGMGTIGKKSAVIGEAFGAEIVYCSTSGKNSSAPYCRLELDDLLKTSDIVLIHAPLNDKTRNLIDRHKLALMKPSAILINTGRGTIVNEADLAEALDAGVIAGAGLDVYSHEPLPAGSPLLKLAKSERLVMTPHIGWCSIEARKRLVKGLAENIKSIEN